MLLFSCVFYFRLMDKGHIMKQKNTIEQMSQELLRKARQFIQEHHTEGYPVSRWDLWVHLDTNLIQFTRLLTYWQQNKSIPVPSYFPERWGEKQPIAKGPLLCFVMDECKGLRTYERAGIACLLLEKAIKNGAGWWSIYRWHRQEQPSLDGKYPINIDTCHNTVLVLVANELLEYDRKKGGVRLHPLIVEHLIKIRNAKNL